MAPQKARLTHPTEQLSLDAARLVTHAAEAKAAQIGVPMNIAVVDGATHLLSFVRMQGAKSTS